MLKELLSVLETVRRKDLPNLEFPLLTQVENLTYRSYSVKHKFISYTPLTFIYFLHLMGFGNIIKSTS